MTGLNLNVWEEYAKLHCHWWQASVIPTSTSPGFRYLLYLGFMLITPPRSLREWNNLYWQCMVWKCPPLTILLMNASNVEAKANWWQRASGNHTEVWVWPGIGTGERSKWRREIWSRNDIPSVQDAGEVTQLLVPEALLCIALLCFAVPSFQSILFQFPWYRLGELWTAVISPWLHFQMLSLENIKKVMGFRSSELDASCWWWQLQGSGDAVFNRGWWASWEVLAHKLRSWVEAMGRGGTQWETWEQLSSCRPDQLSPGHRHP